MRQKAMRWMRFTQPAALALLLLGTVPPPAAMPAHADVGAWSTAGPADRITAVAVDPTNDQHVLAAGDTGVWSTTNGGGTWTKISAAPVRTALAIDPHATTSVYGISGDRKSVLKSADGGATWSPVLPAGLRGAGGIGPTNTTTLAVLPGVAGFAVAGIQVYHGGLLAKSLDSGATWSGVSYGGLAPLAAPSALAVAGTSAATATLYAALNVMQFGSLLRSDDGGATWVDLSAGLPIRGPQGGFVSNLTTNSTQPLWAYMSEWDTGAPPRTGVFATNDGGATWNELGHLAASANGPHGLALAIPSRTVYAATDTGVYQLTIAWPVLPSFQAYYAAHDGPRLLGTGISLQTTVTGHASQYFEKGRLEDHRGESPDPNWQLAYGLLVDELHGGLAPLPVGGDLSTLTYAGLHALADASQRVPAPAAYAGSGTMAVRTNGDTFVPFTVDLTGAPGQVVPGRFWDYLNRGDLFPGGWLHDVGLPISPATDVTVTKYLPDGPAVRHITVQAFQRTVLTLDPLNPGEWQVERANVGSDYRKFFGERVGP